LSKRTVHDAWIPLSSLWTWAQRELGATHVIRGRVEAPGFPKTTIDPFTHAEIAQMVQDIDYDRKWANRPVRSKRATALRDRAIILILLDSGLRASELCALVVGDYDQERGRLYVRHGKGDKARYVFLGDRARKVLWRYLSSRPDAKPTEALFATKAGTHLNRNNLHHMLRDLGHKAGVEHVHPHRFRHTSNMEEDLLTCAVNCFRYFVQAHL
jgi:integrase/recombinase XerD